MEKFEETILDLQITIPTVYTVEILNHSDCWITTVIVYKQNRNIIKHVSSY